MKKLLLSVVFAMVALATTFAADLNPFAYNLKSEYNDKTQTLTINFTLNAPASYVKLAISDGTSDVWTKEYLASNYQAGKVPKATYTETIDALTALPRGRSLTWRVDVKGAAVASPTFVKNDVRLYAPTSVDIDNNPENANFGTVFCVEGRNGAYQASNYSSYISYADGAGLYVLNADGTARKMPFQTEKVRYGYNGGVVNAAGRDKPFFGNNGEYDLNGYNAFRVRVSDDGRIFVTAFSTNGHVLWEAKKECFSATTQAEWSANTGWHQIITANDAQTVMATEKINCSSTNHQYCGIYSLYEGNATSDKFIAGPNLGFDVRGAGDQLKLLMLAGCKQAIVWAVPEHFYCDEYDLGTATLWNTPPSRRVFAGHSKGVDIVNPQGVQVQYDKTGNVWVCQHRAVTVNTTLARVNRALSSTQMYNVNEGQVDYSESDHTFRRCGAIRFNEDFTQVAIASNEYGSGGGFTVYPVNASGMPIWNQGKEVNTYNKTGVSLMDFAWDYAGNLYMAADAATNGERIAVYAMPHTADRVVSTPAASKYAFTVSCQAGKQCTVNTVCNPEVGGTIVCSVEGNVRTGVLTLESCTELTVTATPEDGYKFLNWTDGNDNVLSTNKEFTFYVTEDITLKANFEYATYIGVVWKNLFLGGPDNDIATETAEYPNTNERLWRLLQVEFNKYYTGLSSGNNARADYPDHTSANTDKTYTKNKKQFNTAPFLNVTGNTNFFKANVLFSWLGEYIDQKANRDLSNSSQPKTDWTYYPYLFINRTDSVYNWPGTTGGLVNYVITGTSQNPRTWDSFIEYGKPKHWRPYWAEDVCNLPMTMTYSDYMPTVDTWARPSCPSGYITKNGTSTKIYPSSWYKWNHPDTDGFPEEQKDVTLEKYFILAWRANSPTGDTIVHHVYRNNMELHASYVLMNIDENDAPANPANYDASNEDVIKLMQNPNFDPALHNFTVTRKLQKGMYNTICMPLSIDINGLMDTHHLKNATVLQFSGVTTESYNDAGEPVTVLNFTEIQENGEGQKIIEKGVPYLIMVDENVTEETLLKDMPFTGVARDNLTLEAQNSETIKGITFHGTINPTNIPEGSLILVANNRLALTTAEGGMAGMRGYFTIDPTQASDIAEQAADGRVYLSFQKPTTTSIPVAPEAEQPKQPKVRKVMHNGQIYILRGEEVYTITGHRVK